MTEDHWQRVQRHLGFFFSVQRFDRNGECNPGITRLFSNP